MVGGLPNFTPELERTAKGLSARIDCLILILFSVDEDDLYCMFFRQGKQLPWFKVSVGRSRKGKEREKLVNKLERSPKYAIARVASD